MWGNSYGQHATKTLQNVNTKSFQNSNYLQLTALGEEDCKNFNMIYLSFLTKKKKKVKREGGGVC